MLLYQAAVLEAAQDMGAAAAGLGAASDAALPQQQPSALAPGHGMRAGGSSQPGRKFGQHHFSVRGAAYLGRLPRLHLRRRLTLLLFRHSGVRGGAGDAASVHAGSVGDVEEFVFEEWEVSAGGS